MRTSDAVGEVSIALTAAHAKLKNPRKDTKGQARGRSDYRYLGLPGLIDHAKDALNESGIAVIQEVKGGGGFIEITTLFLHLSGEWIEVGPTFLPAPGDAQSYGAAITYGRRYALAAALNLAADEDTDGASGGSTAKPNTPPGTATPRGHGDGAQAASADAAPPETSATMPADDGSAPGVSAAGLSGEAPAASTPGVGTDTLSRDDQGLLKAQYGGQVKAIQAYKTRFPGVTRLADITYRMRDEMEAQ